MIDQSEMDDFKNAVREAGFATDDFDATETKTQLEPIGGDLIQEITETTVTRKSNGVSRVYHSGDDGTAWVADFTRDLERGFFGKP
jgi:hypothetical protein